MKKASIIIPVYNVEEYIEATITSFIHQTLNDIEIIIVDDGSTDSTCEIIEKYQQDDDRIYILHQENKGAGIARNLGMKHATGEYIYFFDGDDYCIPSFLQTVVKKADETQADIVVFDYYRVDQVTHKEVLYHGLNRSLLPTGKECFNYKDVPDRILSIVNPTPWNKLYRRSYIQNTKLQFLGLSTTNDITFAALSVAMAEKVTYISEPFMYYRVNRKAAITSFKQKKLKNVIAAVNSVIEQSKQLSYFEEIKIAVEYFAICNLIFALENYAGKFLSKYYRTYYKTLHKLFRTELFAEITAETLNNKNIYEKFSDIANNSYEKQFCKKVKKKLIVGLKQLLKRIFPVTKKQFEQQTERLFATQSTEIKMINSQTKQITELTEQIAELKQIINSMGWSGVCTDKRSPRIIVSMTSFPARINTVKTAIESIMMQSVKADKIVLWLAKTNFPAGEAELPEGLLQLKNRGLEIRWCEIDYRSYKKIIPALKEFPDDIIITVDDDLLYPNSMIEQLYNSYKKYPECISAIRAHLITFDEDGTIKPYAEWKKEDSTYIDNPRMDLFATTGAGTLFPPHCLSENATDWDVIKELCPHADDVWIKIMSLLNNVPVILVGEQRRLVYINGTQNGNTLWKINCMENDTQLNRVLEKYNDSSKEKDILLHLLSDN